jgi:hypothetical protein
VINACLAPSSLVAFEHDRNVARISRRDGVTMRYRSLFSRRMASVLDGGLDLCCIPLLCLFFPLLLAAQYQLAQINRRRRVHDSYDHGFPYAPCISKVVGFPLHPLSFIYAGIKIIWLAIFSITGMLWYGEEHGDEGD